MSNISRRDFLNGVLLSSGGAAVLGSIPMRAFGATTSWPADQVGSDPRMQRGGNQPATFNVAHWLRDDRLTWSTNSVKLAPSKLDNNSGTFPILDEGVAYDLVIVGSGISGLGTAYRVLKLKPTARILILDGQATAGGNANRDFGDPSLPDLASTATAYAVAPYAPFLTDLYKDLGMQWDKYVVPTPFYSYFFDSQTPYVNPGTASWNLDTYGKGMSTLPYPSNIVNDILASRADLMNWYNTPGAPTDPADMSDPQFDYLSPMSFANYLTNVKGYHPAVVDFYTRYAVDALASSCENVTAYTSISFLGAEFFKEFAYPGGNSGIARHLMRYLVPACLPGGDEQSILYGTLDYGALDSSANNVRVRQNALVLRGETGSSNAAAVYYCNGQFIRVKAKAVVFAGQMHTGHLATEYLMSSTQSAACDQVTLAPVVTANVALKTAKAVVDLGYDSYYWGSQYWADFVVADWTLANRNQPDRQTVLTFYGGSTTTPDEQPNERVKLLTTPFSSYEDSLRADLARVLAGRDFDFDRDVSAVYLYRWGHSMIYPKPGWPFGAPTLVNGTWVRTPSPRHVARQQLGRISFGAQDVESSPANESAIGAGLRTSQEVIGFL